MPYVSFVKTLSALVAHCCEEVSSRLWNSFFTNVEKILHSSGELINVSPEYKESIGKCREKLVSVERRAGLFGFSACVFNGGDLGDYYCIREVDRYK